MRQVRDSLVNSHIKALFRDPVKLKAELIPFKTDVKALRDTAISPFNADPRLISDYLFEGLPRVRPAEWGEDFFLLGDYTPYQQSLEVSSLFPSSPSENIKELGFTITINPASFSIHPNYYEENIGKTIVIDRTFNLATPIEPGIYSVPILHEGDLINTLKVKHFEYTYYAPNGSEVYNLGEQYIEVYTGISKVHYRIELEIVGWKKMPDDPTAKKMGYAKRIGFVLGAIPSLYGYLTEDNMLTNDKRTQGDTRLPGYQPLALPGEDVNLEITPPVAISSNNTCLYLDFLSDIAGTLELTYSDNTKETKEVSGSMVGVDTIPKDITNIKISNLRILNPNQPIHLSRILLSDVYTFTESDITKVNFSESEDPTGAELPTQTIKLGLSNVDKKFDIDNPKGIALGIIPGARLNYSIGIPSGTETTYVTMASLILRDDPEIRRDEAILTFIDRLSTLDDDVYRYSTVIMNAESIKDISYITNSDLDYRKHSISTEIPVLPQNQHMQILTSCIGASMHLDRFGMIGATLNPFSYKSPITYRDFIKISLTNEDILGDVKVSKIPQIKSLKLSGVQVQEVDDTNIVFEEIYSYSTAPTTDGKITIEFSHPPILTSSFRISGNVSTTMLEPTVIGLDKSIVTVSTRPTDGSGVANITFSARIRETVEQSCVVEVNSIGKDCEVDLPGVFGKGRTSSALTPLAVKADAYITPFLGSLYDGRVYEFDYMQDYRIEPGDYIYIQTRYEKQVPVRVLNSSFTNPGIVGHIIAKRVYGDYE